MAHPDAQQLIQGVDPAVFKSLFKTKPYRHVLALTFDWLIIALTIYFSIQFFSIGVYILAVLIIGARMHALAILTHDATHYRFLKNRKWNDALSNVLTMYPVFASIETYRPNHLRHHQHLNTENDPDWIAKLTKREFEFPKTRMEFLMTVASYFLLYQGVSDAIWFLKRFNGKGQLDPARKENKPLKLGFYLCLAILLTIFGGWKYFLIFWVIPYFSTFFMFQYIRSVAEHFGELAYENDLSSSRTVKASWVEQFFIAPHNVGYHLEHHLYPGVPFYNLSTLHNLLMAQADYQEQAHITQGYMTGLLQELGNVNKARRLSV